MSDTVKAFAIRTPLHSCWLKEPTPITPFIVVGYILATKTIRWGMNEESSGLWKYCPNCAILLPETVEEFLKLVT